MNRFKVGDEVVVSEGTRSYAGDRVAPGEYVVVQHADEEGDVGISTRAEEYAEHYVRESKLRALRDESADAAAQQIANVVTESIAAAVSSVQNGGFVSIIDGDAFQITVEKIGATA